MKGTNTSTKSPQPGRGRARDGQPQDPDRPTPAGTPTGAAPAGGTGASGTPDAATVCAELRRTRVMLDDMSPGEGQWRIILTLVEPLLCVIDRAILVLEKRS